LNPSDKMAILLVFNPIANFIAKRKRLQMIPNVPASHP